MMVREAEHRTSTALKGAIKLYEDADMDYIRDLQRMQSMCETTNGMLYPPQYCLAVLGPSTYFYNNHIPLGLF